MDSTSFTFLATILILVLLSASLVLRSYILRRRYRRHFQQAISDGLFDDLNRNGPGEFDVIGGFRRSTRRLGPKPVVWDTWIHPADKDDTWPSITPVAARCSPLLSPPSTSQSSPLPSITPPISSSRPTFFSQLRIPSPFSLSPRPSSPLPRHSPIGSPAVPSTGSLPSAVPTSPDPSTKDAVTLSVCVLVAMPDVSVPVYHPVSNIKGKGVDPVDAPETRVSGDADPLLPSSLRRSCARISDQDEALPLLEFGVVEMTTGEWVWGI
ncbi:hypothetical protein OG21DRAFT_1509929 [Imleria badia]|nr:hypothetical protein OG21DRAFT_1509929 [Imleria badia]